jgi:t-SNARE complex subunit (syntaxin)
MPSFSSVSEADSDTSAPDEIDNLRAHIAKLEQQVNSLELENKQLLKNVDELLESQFGIARFKDSECQGNAECFYQSF